MRYLIAIGQLMLIILAACSPDPQPADSRARVHFDEDSLVSHRWVNVILEDGQTIWNFGPDDLIRSPVDTSLFTTPEVQTQADGILKMTFRLVTEEDSLFAEGSITGPLSPNWKWSFELVRVPADPPLACGDCLKVDVFGIYDPAFANELIYVLWRGGGP
jgi:hypothetical protein